MSQQELFPEPQENEVQSYYYPHEQRHENEPKEEHPSTFTGEIPPYSYPAQDRVTYTSQQKKRQQGGAAPAQTVDEAGYRQRQVPSWARPQRHPGRTIVRILVAVAIVFLLVKVLPILILGVIALLGGLAFILVLLVFVALGLLMLLLVVGILILLGVPLLRFSTRRRWERW